MLYYLIVLTYQVCVDVLNHDIFQRGYSYDSGSVSLEKTVTIVGCNFQRQTTFSFSGGVIYINGVTINVDCLESIIYSCKSQLFGGFLYFKPNSGTMTVKKCSIDYCNASNYHFAYVSTISSVNLENSQVFYCGSTVSYHTGIQNGHVYLSNCNSTKNSGCFYISDCKNFGNYYSNYQNQQFAECIFIISLSNSGEITNCNFINNEIYQIYLKHSVCYLKHCSFEGSTQNFVKVFKEKMSYGAIILLDCNINLDKVSGPYYMKDPVRYQRVLICILYSPLFICFIISLFMKNKPSYFVLLINICIVCLIFFSIHMNMFFYIYETGLKGPLTYESSGDFFSDITRIGQLILMILLVVMWIIIPLGILGNCFNANFTADLMKYESNCKQNCCLNTMCYCCSPPCCSSICSDKCRDNIDYYHVCKEVFENQKDIVELQRTMQKNACIPPTIKVFSGGYSNIKDSDGKHQIIYDPLKEFNMKPILYGSWQENGSIPPIPNDEIIIYQSSYEAEVDNALMDILKENRDPIIRGLNDQQHWYLNQESITMENFVKLGVFIPSSSRWRGYFSSFFRFRYFLSLIFGYSFVYDTIWKLITQPLSHKCVKVISQDKIYRASFMEEDSIKYIITNTGDNIHP